MKIKNNFKVVKSQEHEVLSIYHVYRLKTKISQWHYVITSWTFGFEAIDVI